MTVASIRSLLRVLIDEPTIAKWTNPNLNTLIFSEYRDICNEIARRWPEYYNTSSSISTTANTRTTALPTTCTYFKKLVNSDGETLRYAPPNQFDHTSSNGSPVRYCVTGRNFWWNPTPDTIYTYTAFYSAMPTDLTGDGDTPDLPPNFHDILAYGTAVKSRLAKEENIAQYYNIYQQKLDMLLHQIGVDQTNNPRRVNRAVDVVSE